jgi:hypothetical protein
MSLRRRVSESSKEERRDLHGKLRHLKKQNQILQREVARLRKYEARYEHEKFSAPDHEPLNKPKELEKPECPSCRSKKTDILDLGIKKFLICKACKIETKI